MVKEEEQKSFTKDEVTTVANMKHQSFQINTLHVNHLNFPEQIVFTTYRNGVVNRKNLMLSEFLGKGYTAKVYMCREPDHPYKIIGAMKIFQKPAFAKFAKKESDSLKRINHPNSVRIIESGDNGYIVNCKTGES